MDYANLLCVEKGKTERWKDLEGEGRMVEGMGRDSVTDELKSETEVKCLTEISFF